MKGRSSCFRALVKIEVALARDEREDIADLLESDAEQELRIAAKALGAEDIKIRFGIAERFRPAARYLQAILIAFAAEPEQLLNSAAFRLARAATYNLVNIYMIKMAAVFIISTSTVAIYTGFSPRWIALLGYVLAAIVLLGSSYMTWSFVVFPIWVLLVSCRILIDDLRRA